MKRILCAMLVVTHLVACTTLTTVPYAQAPGGGAISTAGIAAGDRLHVGLRDGSQRTLTVTTVSADELCAADGCLRAAEIENIERIERRVSLATVAINIALLLVVLAVSRRPHSAPSTGNTCWFCS